MYKCHDLTKIVFAPAQTMQGARNKLHFFSGVDLKNLITLNHLYRNIYEEFKITGVEIGICTPVEPNRSVHGPKLVNQVIELSFADMHLFCHHIWTPGILQFDHAVQFSELFDLF